MSNLMHLDVHRHSLNTINAEAYAMSLAPICRKSRSCSARVRELQSADPNCVRHGTHLEGISVAGLEVAMLHF
eukprot:366052-Chlamydomonas_euryale.AAC.37